MSEKNSKFSSKVVYVWWPGKTQQMLLQLQSGKQTKIYVKSALKKNQVVA